MRGDSASGAQTERRGGAGPVRGLLGGKGPTGRFDLPLRSQESSFTAVTRGSALFFLKGSDDRTLPTAPSSVITGRDHLPAAARAQGLERCQRSALAQKAHGAVGEG